MEINISQDQIRKMDRLPRMNFINTLSGARTAHLIGTIAADGSTNLALFNTIIHIGANPPYLGFIVRPLTVARHSFQNIKATKHFTINQVHQGIYKAAHQASAKYPQGQSEFEAVQLTPQYTDRIKAPYVQESHIKIGLQLVEEHHIQTNNTWLVIGEVLEVLLPSEAIQDTGHIDPSAWGTNVVSGLDTYYSLKPLERLPYARVPKPNL